MDKIVKGTKSAKRMDFSQAVLGKSSERSSKPSVGRIVASSAGKVDENPPRKLPGKRIY